MAWSGGAWLGAVGAAEAWAAAVALAAAAECEIEIARLAARLAGSFAVHRTSSPAPRLPPPRPDDYVPSLL